MCDQAGQPVFGHGEGAGPGLSPGPCRVAGPPPAGERSEGGVLWGGGEGGESGREFVWILRGAMQQLNSGDFRHCSTQNRCILDLVTEHMPRLPAGNTEMELVDGREGAGL